MLLVGWGGGASRALYALRAGSRKKRKKQHRASAKLAPSRRSAPLLVNNERPPAVLLCGSSASENRARRADRSRSRIFSGLRRAELACLRRFRSACGAFRSACGAETNQAKEPGLRRLSTHLLAHAAWIGFGANGSMQIHLLLYGSTLRSAFVRSCFLLVVARTDLWFCF